MRELYCLIAILLAVAHGTAQTPPQSTAPTQGTVIFFTARGAPPPLARAAALEDSLSSRGPQARGLKPILLRLPSFGVILLREVP